MNDLNTVIAMNTPTLKSIYVAEKRVRHFKVSLIFLYNSDEDISDWMCADDLPFKYVTTKEQAVETAQHELEHNSVIDFSFDVEEV